MPRDFHSATFPHGEKVASRPQERAGEMRGKIWGGAYWQRAINPPLGPLQASLGVFD